MGIMTHPISIITASNTIRIANTFNSDLVLLLIGLGLVCINQHQFKNNAMKLLLFYKGK